MSNSPEIELIIDTRERKIKSYFLNHPKSNLKKYVTTQNLDIGDIIFKYQGMTLLLIERKTVEDLGSSILDGRHKEQKYRIINSGIPKQKVMFLIEGTMKDLSFGNIKKNTLLGAIQNTMFRDGFTVYRTSNLEETLEFIERFLDKFIKDKTKNLTHLVVDKDGTDIKSKLEYIDVKKVKKKNNMTPEVFNKLVLLQIPGVSQNIVDRIFEEYNSLKQILDKYPEIDKLDIPDDKKLKQKKNLLADLEMKISNGKKRKIGKVISARIYEFLIY